MKMLMLVFFWLISGCIKTEMDDSYYTSTIPIKSTNDTVNIIGLSPFEYRRGYDTTKNFIEVIQFEHNSLPLANDYEKYSMYMANDDGGLGIRYVGKTNLLESDSLKLREWGFLKYQINKELLNKPLFEIYEINTNEIYRTIVAGKENVQISAQYISYYPGIVDTISPYKIAAAYQYYLRQDNMKKIKFYREN